MREYRTLSVEPLTAVIGARIDGVDLTQPRNERQAAEIDAALLSHRGRATRCSASSRHGSTTQTSSAAGVGSSTTS